MDHLKSKYINRIENFLNKLNNVISLIKDEESSSEKGDEDLSAEDEEYIIDYTSVLLTKYVLSVCKDDDLSERYGTENIEESVESQKLVEHDCNEVYASRIALVLKNLIESNTSLHSFDKMKGGPLFSNSEECTEDTTSVNDSKGNSDSDGNATAGNNNRNTGAEDDFKLDSNSVYSLDFGYVMGKMDYEVSDDPEDIIYSRTEVSNMLRFRACRIVLEFLSDLPFNWRNKNRDCDSNLNSSSSYRSTYESKHSNDATQAGDCKEWFKGNYIGIRYSKHGLHILKRFCYLCMSVSPLRSERHIEYLKSHLSHEGPVKMINLGHFSCSRPWIVYWSLHSLCILGEDIMPYKERAIQTLFSCWDEECGGFGGGLLQRGHVATTYAAICVLKMFSSLHLVDTQKLHSFLMDMKLDSGAFTTTYGGEYDTRSVYCAIASASMTGILTEELTKNTAEFIQSCQTYEGGVAAEPGLEAHAGYTYCGVASLTILKELHRLDVNKLYHWAVCRVTSQFGFQGRPHKLVDSCYSFWIGGLIHIVNSFDNMDRNDRLIQILVRCYLLVIAQTGKGFRDKPNKAPDLYHTCYSLSYLNIISPLAKHKHNVVLNVLEL